jgi:hypothetical protein
MQQGRLEFRRIREQFLIADVNVGVVEPLGRIL